MPKTMKLPCELNDSDRLRIGGQLTAEITAQEQVEAAKKEAMRGFNVTIKEHRAQVHSLNESLRTGFEDREIEIEERHDYAAGIVFIHRLDTGDCVKQRAIDPDERQVGMNLPGPTVLDGGRVDEAARTDEQREAADPEEAERLRAERLAGERAERISAGVIEARERITVVAEGEGDRAWKAVLQYGNKVLEAEAATAAAAADGVARQVVEELERMEDQALTLADAVAASQSEQARQEVERLAAEQAADEAATTGKGKKGFKRGLQAPKGHGRRKHDDGNGKKAKGIKVEDESGTVLYDGANEPGGETEPPPVGGDEPTPPGDDGDGLAF